MVANDLVVVYGVRMKKLTRMFRGMQGDLSGTLSIVSGGETNMALWHGDGGVRDEIRGFLLDFDDESQMLRLYCNTFVFRMHHVREIRVTGDMVAMNVVRLSMKSHASV